MNDKPRRRDWAIAITVCALALLMGVLTGAFGPGSSYEDTGYYERATGIRPER